METLHLSVYLVPVGLEILRYHPLTRPTSLFSRTGSSILYSASR